MIRSARAASPDRQARHEQLARLLPLWPHEVADDSLAGRARICRMLRQAVRRERQLGISGDRAYDLGRHAALVRALVAESQRPAATPDLPAIAWPAPASAI